MAATVKSVYVKGEQGRYPVTFIVHYNDNGCDDKLQKTLYTKDEANKWLDLWRSDTGEGLQHIEAMQSIVNKGVLKNDKAR